MVVLLIILAALLALIAVSYGVLFKATIMRGKPITQAMIAKRYEAHPNVRSIVLTGFQWIQAQQSEVLYIVSCDGLRLHGRLIRAEGTAIGTILLAHGFHSSPEYDFSAAARFYHELGYNLLLIDERAHGQSEGAFIGYGVLEKHDITAWARRLGNLLGEELDLYLSGISMGAASVLMAAALPLPSNVRGIIADCGFTTPRAIFTHVLGIKHKALSRLILLPIRPLLKRIAGYDMDADDTREALKKCPVPVLLVHGTGDDFVPPGMSRENYAANPEKCQLLLVEGAAHGQSYLVDTPLYQQTIRAFLAETASHPLDHVANIS